MKNREINPYKKITIKEIVIIAITIIALVVLIFVILNAKKESSNKQKELNNLSEQLEKETYLIDASLGELIINEVSYDGKVELYSNANGEIDLTGIGIKVDGELKYTISEDEIIEEQDFYVVETETDFTSGSRLVEIYNSESQCVYSMMIPKLSENESYGRNANGANKMSKMTCTIGEGNESATVAEVTELTFSVPGGFYKEKFSLEMYAPEGSKIYYTTDGSKPTVESNLYESAIEIKNASGKIESNKENDSEDLISTSKATVIKAITVSEDGTESDVYTESYFVGIGFGKDYLNIPVISLSIEPDDMFGYFDGIYVAGRTYEDSLALGEGKDANYLQEWIRTGYIEYFEPNKCRTYAGNIDLSVDIDYSVSSAQKSFNFMSDSMNINKASTLSNYIGIDSDSFKLSTNQRDNVYKIRDYLSDELTKDLNVGQNNNYPCILFINGEYWGGYMMNEKKDAQYIKQYYGITDDVVVYDGKNIECDEAIQKEMMQDIAFILQADMSVDENYQKFLEIIDVDSYLDYFCSNMIMATADYNENGMVLFRTVSKNGEGVSDGKWRYFYGNMDCTMANGMIGNYSTYSIDSFLRPGVKNDVIFWSLIKNDTFKTLFKEKMEYLLNNTFSIENVTEALEKVENLTKKLSTSTNKRFISEFSDDYYESEERKILYFFENRAEYITIYMNEVLEQGILIYGEEETTVEGETTAAGETTAEVETTVSE